MRTNAFISECGTYRTTLERAWGPRDSYLGFVMLNPSKADELGDDPTIRRCMAFARRDGYDGIIVENLFSYRATKPTALLGLAPEVRVGPSNAVALRALSAICMDVIVAWGAHPLARQHWKDSGIGPFIEQGSALCLGTTKIGAPKHPLYVPGDAPFVLWTGYAPS